MTGYQKLKTERNILWGEVESWIEEYGKQKKKEDKNFDLETFCRKEMAYIKAKIEDETN